MRRKELLKLGCIALLCVAIAAPALAGKNKLPPTSPPEPPVVNGPLPPPVNPDSLHPPAALPIVSSTGDIRIINAKTTMWGYTAPPPPTAGSSPSCLPDPDEWICDGD